MFYRYPFYASPYSGGYGYGYNYPGIGPGFGYGGYPGYGGFGGYGYGGTNIIGSAIANQNQNVIGTGAIGGNQTATPTAIW